MVCAYDELTKRFSEDADFRIVPCPNSAKNIRERLTDIAKNLTGFSLFGEPRSDSRKIEFNFINEDIEKYLKGQTTLRPTIKIEFYFTDSLFYSEKQRKNCSFYDKIGKMEFLSINCVSLEDTTIDKISSFMWRILSGRKSKYYAPQDMRHLYDLSFLKSQIEVDIKFKKCLMRVWSMDMNNRLKETKKDFKTCVNEVVILLNTIKDYRKDYDKYVKTMSYAKTAEQLLFDGAVNSFECLIEKIMKIED